MLLEMKQNTQTHNLYRFSPNGTKISILQKKQQIAIFKLKKKYYIWDGHDVETIFQSLSTGGWSVLHIFIDFV